MDTLPTPAAPRADLEDEVSLTPDAWLRSRIPEAGLGASARRLVNYLLTNVGEAGFAKAADVAEAVGVSISSVTRLAQQLGFEGWPHLQRDLRARYLAQLTMVDVADIHSVTDPPFQSSLRRDAVSLRETIDSLDDRIIGRVAELLHGATRIHVTAMGSFAAVGLALSHNLLIAGYPTQALLDRDALLTNTVATLGEGDVLVVCSYWRHYRTVVGAAVAAHARGARIVAIADYLPAQLAEVVDEAVLIPAEGTSFFASLTVPMAVQQGIMATLARLDPERTRQQMRETERLWTEIGLLVDPRSA